VFLRRFNLTSEKHGVDIPEGCAFKNHCDRGFESTKLISTLHFIKGQIFPESWLKCIHKTVNNWTISNWTRFLKLIDIPLEIIHTSVVLCSFQQDSHYTFMCVCSTLGSNWRTNSTQSNQIQHQHTKSYCVLFDIWTQSVRISVGKPSNLLMSGVDYSHFFEENSVIEQKTGNTSFNIFPNSSFSLSFLGLGLLVCCNDS
jgi:hypothetical protein